MEVIASRVPFHKLVKAKVKQQIQIDRDLIEVNKMPFDAVMRGALIQRINKAQEHVKEIKMRLKHQYGI